ncbi:A24 family peptidase [Sphingomonas sp. SUN039]|uniref:prepilin peptidase n=1 Tax=Sphingomonas sp. SUN039 TaxID=2937787 RepID=UPI002164EBA3|nr:A24 family peptidase [Sphingomonas sp. SUN039]UVO53944.1 prepilin peptidase [Sphingomonas sp. SUN039]
MIWLWPALGAGAGLIAGSFLATLVVRWPMGAGLGGRSMCDSCHVPLGARDLVPLVSFALAKGRCRTCGDPIDPVHPIVEGLCTAVGFVALAVSPDAAGATAMFIGWLLVALAALDVREFWLPDVLTAALGMVAVLSSWVVDPPGITDRVIGGAVAFVSLWLIATLYRRLRGREGLGGGDPKLFGAVGLWLGWQPLPFVLLGASAIGLIAVLAMMLRGRAVSATTRLPFGTLLAVAAFPVWLIMR